MHIVVHIATQQLHLYRDDGQVMHYSVSTARNGIGQQRDSEQTPLGRHMIRAKIGADAPLHTVFVGRRPTGEIYSPALAKQYPKPRDWILTRILWLSGLEPGYNRLGPVDTMGRYIYIHGSPDSAVMGHPGSRGCIRMHGQDIIDLFQQVTVGTPITLLAD